MVLEVLKRLALTIRQEFGMWLRQRTSFRSVEEAEEKRFFWAKMYLASAVALLMCITYTTIKRGVDFDFKVDKSIPQEIRTAFALSKNKNSVKVIEYKGFTKVGEVVYSGEELHNLRNPVNKS